MNATIRTKLCTVIYCALSATALCALSTSVPAQEVPSKTVRFDDLDIARPAGAQVLYDRIRAAARVVCQLSASSDPILRQVMRPCVDKAIDEAVRKVDAPVLTALRFGSDVRLASK